MKRRRGKNAYIAYIVPALLFGTLGYALVYPTILNLSAAKIVSVVYIDRSLSNSSSESLKLIKSLCKSRLNQLQDGDVKVDGVFFAGQVEETNRTPYNGSGNRECDTSFNPTSHISRVEKGTSPDAVFDNVLEEISKHGQPNGVRRSIALTVMLNAAEPVKSSQYQFDPVRFVDKVRRLETEGVTVLLLISDQRLRSQIQKELVEIDGSGSSNIKVNDYSDIESGTEWVHSSARSRRTDD
jgi:hypothetical protein